MKAFALPLAMLLSWPLPAAAQAETAAPLAPQARVAMLALSFALSREAPGGADLLRFSDLSARLSMRDGPVSPAEVSGYAQLAAQLVEASLAAGAPAREAAAPLQKLRQALSDRLDAADGERLDAARRRLTEVRSASALARARALARALAPGSNDDSAVRAALRPPIEWWTVGPRRFESTAALVQAHCESWAAGGLAVHHFRHALPGPRARTLAGLSVATISVGWIAGFFAVLAAMAGWTAFPGAVAAAVARVLPATFRFAVVVAAAVAAASGWNKGVESNAVAQSQGASVQGTLRLEGAGPDRKVLFIPARPRAVPVDLSEYARAPVSAPPAAESRSDDMMAGALGMALILAAAFLPLFVGDFLAVKLAARKHAALARRLGLPALALASGVGLVLIAQALLLIGASCGWWLTLGLALGIGALWGKLVLPRLRAAEAAEELERGQWWSVK